MVVSWRQAASDEQVGTRSQGRCRPPPPPLPPNPGASAAARTAIVRKAQPVDLIGCGFPLYRRPAVSLSRSMSMAMKGYSDVSQMAHGFNSILDSIWRQTLLNLHFLTEERARNLNLVVIRTVLMFPEHF